MEILEGDPLRSSLYTDKHLKSTATGHPNSNRVGGGRPGHLAPSDAKKERKKRERGEKKEKKDHNFTILCICRLYGLKCIFHTFFNQRL